MKPLEPNLKTPTESFSKEELNKIASRGFVGSLEEGLNDTSAENISWESEQLAKSHGLYLEFNRATTGREKDWMYMLRMSIPGGGLLSRQQWRVFDDLSEKYGRSPEDVPSLRLTTRQSLQFHWVKKENVVPLVRGVAESGLLSLNACGDNVRNVMSCPLSSYNELYDEHALTEEIAHYFQLPEEPHLKIFGIDPNYERTDDSERFDYGPGLLNRKFKIALASIHKDQSSGDYVADNCVELRTNDIGILPLLEAGEITRFQVYVGGGQGERNGKTTFSTLGKPFGVFNRDELVKGLDAIVGVHRDWGDRQNRHWARLKYVIQHKGTAWLREQVEARGVNVQPIAESAEPGARHLHHGWQPLPGRSDLAFGAFIENGRLTDGPNGNLKSMVRHLMDTYPIKVAITPNQDLIFTEIPAEAKAEFTHDLERHGYGTRNGKPISKLREQALACVGLPTCRLAYTDSEQYLPILLDELEERGCGGITSSIGMAGCERQCSRPGTKEIGWIGSGKNQYKLKLGGTLDAGNQGQLLIDDEQVAYLTNVPRERTADVTEAIFKLYAKSDKDSKSLGHFLRDLGLKELIGRLKSDPLTADLMEKTRTLESFFPVEWLEGAK